MVTIHGSDGRAKIEAPCDDNSTQAHELQGDNTLTLSFTLYEHVALEVNDWAEFEGQRYWLMERYKPEQVSTVEWKYDVKLYGIESLVKRFLVINDTDGDDEPVFTLTAPPREHVALIVKSINNGMDHTTDWKVGTVEGSENITIDYEGKYCDGALKEVAEKAGNRAEWWVEGQTVNVCRCELGEEVTLGYGKGLTGISCDLADNADFYTRLYPIGSSRNIDPERYGHSRLQLPNGARHVDVEGLVEKYGVWHRYESAAFADIYPKRVGTVSSVRSEEVADEDGNPYKIFYFKDNNLDFDPNDYEIGGKVKRVSFQEGSELAGVGSEEAGTYYLEANFDSATREFEIITIWPFNDDTQLPNDTLCPKAGDKYVLWNIRMPDEYYPLAEKEFREAVDRYNEENAVDTGRYKAPTDHVWIEENGVDLYVGRRVRLESAQYFPETGFRSSRITKVTRRVNLPSQMDIEICDATSTGAREAISDNIADAKNYVKAATSGSFPDLIRSWDNTYPTDNNVFSARRALKEALSKKTDDTARGKITFLQGVNLGEYKAGESGGAVDGEGNAEWQTAVIRELLRSVKFVDGLTGEGWQLWMDELTGLSRLTVDKVTVRQALVALELLIEKVRGVGGQLVVSAASGKIKSVTKEGDNYKITFERANEFVAGDLIRCAEFGGTHAYWVEVSAADGDGVTVPAGEFGGAEPKAGDECVLMGNTADRLRQNLISISATEDGQPRVDVLDGVKGKSFEGCLRVRLGNLDGISDSRFPADNQPRGNGLYGDNAWLRGTFVLTTGEDVLTRFEVTEGKIESAVEGLRKDFTEDKSWLDNASFGEGMNKWDTENEATFFLLGNKWIWANGGPLADKTAYACVRKDDGRTTVYIKNRHILQKNENFRFIPAYDEVNDEGQKKPEAVYLSFFYRVAKAGRLTIGFEGLDKTGFENFNEFSYDGELEETEGYRVFNHSGLWNGTGDFKLAFTGEIYLYMLVLSTDRAEALAVKYKTLFEQSEKLVKIAAANFDRDGGVIEGSQIVTKADMNLVASGLFDEEGKVVSGAGLVSKSDMAGMFAIDKEGNLKSFVGATAEGVKIRASSISLEGTVTANEGFKILEDGSMEATAGKIGNLRIEGGTLKGEKMSLNDARLTFSDENGSVYVGGHPDSMYGGSTKLGAFIIAGGGYGGLVSTVKVALICSAPVTREYDLDSYNSYALWANGMSVFGGLGFKDRQGVKSGTVTIRPDDSVLLIDGDTTLQADPVLATSGIVHLLVVVNVSDGEPSLYGTEGRDRVLRFRNQCCKVVAYANGRWYPHSDYKD